MRGWAKTGYLGAVRERAAEGSLLFDEAEKAHPRVLDIMLQLLDAARITVATGQTLDFSGFYVVADFQHRLGGIDEPATFQRRDTGTPRPLPRAADLAPGNFRAHEREARVRSPELRAPVGDRRKIFVTRNRVPRGARPQARTGQGGVAVSRAERVSSQARRAPDARCGGETRGRRRGRALLQNGRAEGGLMADPANDCLKIE